MRWFVVSLFALFLAWAAFLVSPFVALHSFARSIEAKDVAAIHERVDFPRLRASLARQIAGGYLKAKAARQDDGPFGQITMGAGASVVEPLIEPYATPEALIAIFGRGLPAIDAPGAPTSGNERALLSSDASPDRLLELFWAVERRGFSRFALALPLQAAPAERFQAVFRLSGIAEGLTWQLVALELPDAVRNRLAAEFAKRETS